MTGRESSPVVSRVEKVPRRKEYLLKLSDGSVIRVLKDHLTQFRLEEGRRISEDTICELRDCYEYVRARETALRLLKVRPRTEEELKRDFRRRRFSDAVSQRVIGDLRREGQVDDRAFARLWIKEKIGRGMSGRKLVRRDLESKGVDRSILEEELAQNYDHTKEMEIARRLAIKRLARMEALPAHVRKRRVYNHLLRRGFGSGVALDAVDSAFAAAEGKDNV